MSIPIRGMFWFTALRVALNSEPILLAPLVRCTENLGCIHGMMALTLKMSHSILSINIQSRHLISWYYPVLHSSLWKQAEKNEEGFLHTKTRADGGKRSVRSRENPVSKPAKPIHQHSWDPKHRQPVTFPFHFMGIPLSPTNLEGCGRALADAY